MPRSRSSPVRAAAKASSGTVPGMPSMQAPGRGHRYNPASSCPGGSSPATGSTSAARDRAATTASSARACRAGSSTDEIPAPYQNRKPRSTVGAPTRLRSRRALSAARRRSGAPRWQPRRARASRARTRRTSRHPATTSMRRSPHRRTAGTAPTRPARSARPAAASLLAPAIAPCSSVPSPACAVTSCNRRRPASPRHPTHGPRPTRPSCQQHPLPSPSRSPGRLPPAPAQPRPTPNIYTEVAVALCRYCVLNCRFSEIRPRSVVRKLACRYRDISRHDVMIWL